MSFLTSMRPALSRATFNSNARLFSTSPVSRVAKITVVGRLAAAPELVTTSTGHEIVRYAVGTSSGSGDSRTTSWWKVASFANEGPGRDRLLTLGKGPENANVLGSSLVYVEGDASIRKYEREGRQESGLSIVQSKLDVLKRNEASAADNTIVEED